MVQETQIEKEHCSPPADTRSASDGDENGMDFDVHDSSVDYKGRLPRRASTGSWRASFFIIAIEFSERLTYFGMATNLITYMTKVMHQDLETAANSVNIWNGVTAIIPLLGGFLADAYFGGYMIILCSAVLYVLGLGILAMTQYIPSLKPCGSTLNSCEGATRVHEVVFFAAAYLVSLATGGYRPCLESFGADQFDDNHAKERKQKMSFFNWWSISLCCGLFLGSTLIVYLEDNIGWGVAFLILSIVMVATVLVFLLGRPFYRYRTSQGSPLTPMFQVLSAAILKRRLALPAEPDFLHEVPKSEEKVQGRRLAHTNQLRFFDKAAIIEYENGETAVKKQSPWRLATVTQVEELKLVIKMVPIWLTCLIFGIGIAQGSTFYIKQASAMNRRVSKQFEIPAASISTMMSIGMLITVALYDRLLIPYLRRATGNERGINILKRIGIGMILLLIAVVVSALVERQRLRAYEKGNVISVFWLVPQYFILGVGDGFSLVGMQEYFYDQVPDSMRSLGLAFYCSVIGAGSFVTTLVITIVNHVTGINGGKKWIGKDVNHSRLEYFYWLLAVISVLNVCAFVLLAKNYTYKKVDKSDSLDDEGDKGQKSVA